MRVADPVLLRRVSDNRVAGRLARLGIVVAGLALASSCGSATAATISSQPTYLGAVVRYAAAPGESNALQVQRTAAGALRFNSVNTAPLTDGDGSVGCTVASGSPTVATCPGHNVARVEVALGDGNDIVVVDSANFENKLVADGGTGDDWIFTGPKNDSVSGGEGEDTIHSGDGDDTLKGGAGKDVLNGGNGTDAVDYSDHGSRVDASLDGVANDGNASDQSATGSDRENVSAAVGIESITGTAYDDVLNGDQGPNALLSGDGRDFVYGQRGNDVLIDGSGPVWYGDILDGSYGDDVIYGGAGGDYMFAGPGRDSLSDPIPLFGIGGTGVNEYYVIDGSAEDLYEQSVDTVTCGVGSDWVRDLGPSDQVTNPEACETIEEAYQPEP